MDEMIAGYLAKYCSGKDKTITSRELEIQFGVRGPELRKLINGLRKKGFPICSCASGYYYANTKEELLHSIHQLLSRSREIAAAARGMIKALPQYQDVDQLDLFSSGGGRL